MPTRTPLRLALIASALAAVGAPAAAQSPEAPSAPLLFPELARPGGEAAAIDPLAPIDRRPVTLTRKAEALGGTLSGKQVVPPPGAPAPWEGSAGRRSWQSEQDWRCPLAGPFTAFGRVGASGEEVGQADTKVTGRAGLTCRAQGPFGTELELRGGRGLSCADPLRPERAQPRSELFVEVQGRLPLFGGAGLEYQGSATPALAPQERDRLQQDLGLAVPVGDAGKLKLGARHRWETAPEPRPLTAGLQLYLGLELAL